MSDITLIDDSEQSSLVTNGLAKNGELYLKAAGSTDAGAIVVYDSGSWRTFANEAASFSNTYSLDLDGTNAYMDIPDSTALETAAFTWSAWFYCTAINRYNIIVDTATSSTSFLGYELFVVNTNNNNRAIFTTLLL